LKSNLNIVRNAEAETPQTQFLELTGKDNLDFGGANVNDADTPTKKKVRVGQLANVSEEFSFVDAYNQSKSKPRSSIFPCFWNKNSDERSQLARRRVQVESVFASNIETITVDIWRLQKLRVGESVFEDVTRNAPASSLFNLPDAMDDAEAENIDVNIVSSLESKIESDNRDDINGSWQAIATPVKEDKISVEDEFDLEMDQKRFEPHFPQIPLGADNTLDSVQEPADDQAYDFDGDTGEELVVSEERVISPTSTLEAPNSSNMRPQITYSGISDDIPDATPKSISTISHSRYYRKETSGLQAEATGDIGLRKIMSIEIDRREAKTGVGSVQKIYDELYDRISPDERLGLYTKFVLVNEHGQYLRPMSELSEYFNINKGEDGEYHLDGRLNLFLQQRVHKFFDVEKIRKCTCFGVIKFVFLLVLVFGFALTIVFLVLVAVVIEFSIFSSIILTNVNDEVSGGASFFYALYALFCAFFPIYLFSIFIGISFETAMVFLGEKRELPAFNCLFPESVKTWHRWHDPIRFGFAMLLVLIILLFVFFHPSTLQRIGLKQQNYDEDIDTGLFQQSVATVCFFSTFVICIAYASVTTYFDIKSFYMFVYENMWFTRSFTFEKRIKSRRSGRSYPYVFEEVFVDWRRDECWWLGDLSKETIGWKNWHKFLCWAMSNVQFYWLTMPVLGIPIMAAAKQPASSVAFWFFIPYIGLFFQCARHWRTQLYRFGDYEPRKIPLLYNRRYVVGVFAVTALCLVMFLMGIYMAWYEDGASAFNEKEARLIELSKTPIGEPYPICNLAMDNVKTVGGSLAALDALNMARIVYDDVEDGAETMESQFYDWFGNDSGWQFLHNQTSDNDAVFFHAHHAESKTELISIRGSHASKDWANNFAIAGGSAALRVMDYFVPISTLVSTSVILEFVVFADALQSIFYPKDFLTTTNYNQKVMDYVEKETNGTNDDHFVIFTGHSLGGLVAEISAAKFYETYHRNVRSLSIANPGALWTAGKFNINIRTFQLTSTTINAERDIVPLYSGKPGGMAATIKCRVPYYADCHSKDLLFCEMVRTCWKYGTVHPTKANVANRVCLNSANVTVRADD